VEVKARVADLQSCRALLRKMGGGRVGSFRQVDTYFAVSRGRLKIRESDRGGSLLVYYVRENIRGPKVSDVYLAPLSDPKAVKTVLSQVLGVGCVVKKRREIFRLRGIQVHLDHVEGLGSFIELEKNVAADVMATARTRKQLGVLLKKLGVPQRNLQRASYRELLMSGGLPLHQPCNHDRYAF